MILIARGKVVAFDAEIWVIVDQSALELDDILENFCERSSLEPIGNAKL